MKRIYENKASLNETKKQSGNVVTSKKIDENYGKLFFPDIFDKETRPYFTGSMILSLDGRMGFEDDPSSRTLAKSNKEDPTQGLADLWMVNVLRTFADAIILGSATLHAEPEFTGHVYDPDLQQYRMKIPNRYRPVPWNVLITRTPEKLPWEHPVLIHEAIPVLMIIPTDAAEKNSFVCWKKFLL